MTIPHPGISQHTIDAALLVWYVLVMAGVVEAVASNRRHRRWAAAFAVVGLVATFCAALIWLRYRS